MSETEKNQNQPLKVVLEKADDYKLICIDGVYGELDPNRGRLQFFNDTIESDVNSDLSLKPKQLKRTLLFELRMPPETWINIAQWMVDYSKLLNNWREKELDRMIDEKNSKRKK